MAKKFPHSYTETVGKQTLVVNYDLEDDYQIIIEEGGVSLDVTKLFDKAPNDIGYRLHSKIVEMHKENDWSSDDSDFVGNREIDLLC